MHLNNNSKCLRRLSNAVATALFSSMAVMLPADSAENVYFDYGYLGLAISTASLETFVEDGTVNDELAPYLGEITASSRQELQQFLGTPLSELDTSAFGKLSNPFVLSQWL